MGDNYTWIRHNLVVWVDVGLQFWQAHTYSVWMFRDGEDEFGPIRGFDVPFDGVGDWNPAAVPPPDGELTSTEVSVAQSGHHPVTNSSVAAPESEPEESQAGYGPMDVEMEEILEEGEPEAQPEEEVPEEEAKPDMEANYNLPYEQWLNYEFMLDVEPVEDPVKEEPVQDPSESGDINHPIEIEPDSESSEEEVPDEDSDKDEEDSESEWTPSKGG